MEYAFYLLFIGGTRFLVNVRDVRVLDLKILFVAYVTNAVFGELSRNLECCIYFLRDNFQIFKIVT